MKRVAGIIVALLPLAAADFTAGATTQKRYYAHEAVEDAHGVIAPWYKGQNGQCDLRIRIAAETLKRYPWTDATKAVAAVPEYVFNGKWQIAPDGTITVPPIHDWLNGDQGQRAAYVLSGLVDYYRYSGDAAAIAHIITLADTLLDHCQTPADHPWPNFLISVPNKGKPYGQCDPRGFIQLDIVAEVGLPLIRAAQLTGNTRWLEAARHWGDLLAAKRYREPGLPPWGRYANPQDVPWEDRATGGVAFILDFFDALIRAGHTGADNGIVQAREAGVNYLRDVLLPDWTGGDTWGRNYWDWNCFVQVENVTEFAARYLMEHPDEFPNWRNDTRNIMSLFLNRTSVSPASKGDVYSGAWAYPESSGCCGRSLWYGPMELANLYAQYGVLADSEWGRELARRQIILATYGFHETGVVEDNIDGGAIVAGDWFKIAHPMALKHVLAVMAWLPEVLGPSRENHIMRSSSVVTHVVYRDGLIYYRTQDAPPNTVDVLRLAFRPDSVTADGERLTLRKDDKENGYRIEQLPDGDYMVTIRHDRSRDIVIRGDDPQRFVGPGEMTFTGNWRADKWHCQAGDLDLSGNQRVTSDAGAAVTCSFTGNQFRLTGMFGPAGGRAEVYLDEVKQLAGIDCWNPEVRHGQVLYYKSGLTNAKHTLKVVTKGAGNPLSRGTEVYIQGLQYSAAGPQGPGADLGEGGGPTDTQRFVFGYPGREDYVDSAGNAWRPGTEFVVRAGALVDSVAASWWTRRTRLQIDGTDDPELYRYGVHGPEFWVNFTVGPGTYYARLKFVEPRSSHRYVKDVPRHLRGVTIEVNGTGMVTDMDIAATAGGFYRAVDLVFNHLQPRNGVIAIRFSAPPGGEAIIQAIEVGPGHGGEGAAPIPVAVPAPAAPESAGANLLINGGFEEGAAGKLGALGQIAADTGWNYVFAGAGQSYIFPESAYGVHPEWGLPVFHSGAEALRTHTDGGGHTIVYQEVQVKPDAEYVASVWVRADDLHGKGFGKSPGDSAGLRVQELNQAGGIVVDHAKQAVTTAGDFKKLSLSFKTDNKTAKVRFVLDTIIACRYDQGHVTYDDCVLAPASFAPLSKQDYINKCKGAWAGQMIGVCYGAPYEFRYNGRPIGSDVKLQKWTPDRVAGAIGQDDCYVEMTFLRSLERRGLDITCEQAGRDFAESNYPLAHANYFGRENCRRGIMPPRSGSPEYNYHADDIDFQIESDVFGIICPGLPRESNRLCDVFGHLMNYGDGVYGGMYVAGMYAAAFFENDDVEKVVRAGLACIPAESQYQKCISEVIKWHRENPSDWLAAWKKIEEKWQDDVDCIPGNAFNIDAKLNGAYIAVGLLYGEGDIRKTMEIATRCGQDADCNPSSAAGVLGCMKGFDALDEDLVSGIPAIENTNFAFTHYSFKTLIPACQRMAEKIIRRAGGTITEDGYLIPRQSPKAPDKLEQWENQMDLLKNAIPPFAMQLWDPAWKLVQCGASNPGPGLYGEHRGRRDVLLLRAVDETEPAIIQADLTVPAGSHPKMVIPAAAWDRQEDVVLKVFINDNVALEKLIADEGKWVTASVDLTGHEGKRINARVEIHPKGRRLEAAYLDQIEIK